MPDPYTVVVTCEHGGNAVPRRYADLFKGKTRLLDSHRGYDHGALTLAKILSSALGCSLYYSTVTRLLVDLNRSPDNPRRFSEWTRGLEVIEKERIENTYYLPYRGAVEDEAEWLVSSGAKVLHVSVHSFTPVLRGKRRDADVGLLYDPKRRAEAEFCSTWRKALLSEDSSLRVRMNYPYRGAADGLPTYLRQKFSAKDYLGIEIELNQKYLRGNGAEWRSVMRGVAESLKSVLSS